MWFPERFASRGLVPHRSHGVAFGAAALACALVGGACAPESPAIRVRIDWPAAEGAPRRVHLRGRVRLAGEAGTAGEQSVGPVDFGSTVGFSIGNAPFGRGHVIEVEVTEERNSEVVLYFGRSAPFDLDADGVRGIIVVRLQPPPRAGTDSLRIAGRPEVINDPRVELVLISDTAVFAELSNLPDFVAGVVEIDLAGRSTEAACPLAPGESAPSECVYRVPWDLDDGVDDPCIAEDFCGRRVFARFVDDRGVRSAAVSTSVRLDMRPPGLASTSIRYLDASGVVLGDVTAAPDGGRVQVSLVFDELVDARDRLPQLTATLGDSALDFRSLDGTARLDTTFTFVAIVSGAEHRDGTYVPRVEAMDQAGNVSDRLTFEAPIDVDARDDTLLVDQDRLSYIRRPWGNAAPEPLETPDGVVVFTLPPGVGAAELSLGDGLEPVATFPPQTFLFANGDAPLRIEVWRSTSLDAEDLLATARSNPDGTWPRDQFGIGRADVTRVYVRGVDQAGNRSDPVLVRSVWWVGSSARAPSGSSPHTLSQTTEINAPLAVGARSEPAPELDAPDGWGLRVRAEPRWRPKTGPQPTSSDLALAFDAGRGVVVGFDGDRTWTWDGDRWLDHSISRPPLVGSFGLAYDAKRGHVLLVGVNSTSGGLEVWGFDGSAWSPHSAATRPPPRREGFALAYDSANEVLVLFGGFQIGVGTVGDLWTWDGRRWQERDGTGGPAPPALSGARLAYDPSRSGVVLFGDCDEPCATQTWLWRNGTWSSITDADPPDFLSDGFMAWSGTDERLLLGGHRRAPDGTRGRAIWSLGPAGWALTSTASTPSTGPTTSFPPSGGLVTVSRQWDPELRDSVTSTWLGSATRWRDRTTSREEDEPPLVELWQNGVFIGAASMIHDRADGRMVLARRRPLNETPPIDVGPANYAWDGRRWRDITPTGRAPGVHLLYDTGLGRLLGFEVGEDGDLLSWVQGQWTALPVTNELPSWANNFFSHRVYDCGANRLLAIGMDSGEQQTWRLAEDRWEELNRLPGNRGNSAVACDEQRGRVVLFGGAELETGSGPGSTFELDGDVWRDLTPADPASSPTARVFPAMTYDGSRQRVVLFGGNALGAGALGDTWEWDGNTWRQIIATGPQPNPRQQAVMAYDWDRQQTVLSGGQERNEARDTWELEPSDRPAIQLGVALDPALEHEEVRGARIRAVCAGNSPEGMGAKLFGWLAPGRWELLASNTADVDSPKLMDVFRTDRPEQLVVLGNRAFVQCRSAGSSQRSQDATVAADYLEVRVHYLLSSESE